ncbi:hypothetical protein F4677DRAFT_262575 [Hypoxylon crocopeplum]|nr:hypothetical protein F4677DRAFT_262575 [Hypoxylon crocopeplum]
MNDGSYNNVIRSNSPFSSGTPSTPNAYKANVNRTKTRKWVEAKTQNYDGDDWGNEYEDEYEEAEPEPEPEPAPSRVAALRHPSTNPLPQSRTFSQPPTTVSPSNASGLSGVRSPSSPPSLHIQTGVNPRARPTESSGQGPSRFPPRKSSMGQQDAPDFSNVGAPRSGSRPGSSSSAQPWTNQRAASPPSVVGNPTNPSHFVRPADIYRRMEEEREKERRSMESSRPSIDSAYARRDGASSPANPVRSSTEQRRRTSLESHDGSDTSRGLKQTLAPVEERKSEYGMDRLIANAPSGASGDAAKSDQGRVDPPRLSASPKLPDLTRMSGFGDDLFSTSGDSSTLARPSLPPTSEGQQTDVADAKPGPLPGPDDKRRDTTGPSEEKHPPSALEGPKLEPNPKILMPPLDNDLEPKKEDPVETFQQPALPRPQLPGTWVSETVSGGLGRPTPTEKVDGFGPASLGSIVNTDVSPMSTRHAEPADLEPTTTVRQLPSPDNDSDATERNKTPRESGADGFNSPTGKHDDTVASKVVAAGPGHHPTPRSLPPLKTDNSVVPSGIAQKNSQEAARPTRANDMAPLSSTYKNSPSQSSSTQQSAATTGPNFTPTAPLNPHRAVVAPADLTTPIIKGRKSTMSTVDTASPEKESDKLREEIIKSLSASPATTPDASVILGPSSFDPALGGLTRESTYLSGVYDDYLAPAEDKSLQETGQILKQGPNIVRHGTDETETATIPSLQKDNAFPEIAPLSPHRSPVQETAHRPRRFSWEHGPEKAIPNPVEAKPPASVLSYGPSPGIQGKPDPAQVTESEVTATSSGALQVQVDKPSSISHQVSQASSRAPDLSATALEPPSPLSTMADKSPKTEAAAAPDTSRLSFAEEKEKVLIQSSSNRSSTDQHPALTTPSEPIPTPSPVIQQPTTIQSTPRAKIMAFRDILNIASIEHRIQKFDETRTQFYSMESGLSNWIAYIKSQPDYGTVAVSGGQPGGTLAQGQTSPSGVQPPTQQPYYQQYLNASNPGAPPAPPGRTSTGNLQQVFTGQPMSSFGSSNQVGVKSKELLQAAGAFGNKGMKSGMKLFNKGKNKLRGSGDRAFF